MVRCVAAALPGPAIRCAGQTYPSLSLLLLLSFVACHSVACQPSSIAKKFPRVFFDSRANSRLDAPRCLAHTRHRSIASSARANAVVVGCLGTLHRRTSALDTPTPPPSTCCAAGRRPPTRTCRNATSLVCSHGSHHPTTPSRRRSLHDYGFICVCIARLPPALGHTPCYPRQRALQTTPTTPNVHATTYHSNGIASR